MSIYIDKTALDRRLDGGRLWVTGTWGEYENADTPTCLHGAIRHCQPVPGDAFLIEQVGTRYGFGIGDNDRADLWDEIKSRVPDEITDEMLAATFGPQWEAIVALVRRAAVLTEDEAVQLNASKLASARTLARAAGDAVSVYAPLAVTARYDQAGSAWYATQYIAPKPLWSSRVVQYAAWALAIRDLIGQHGFTQAHYNTLTRPWATTIGPVHPDDKQVTA